MQRTLKRELKDLEVVDTEAISLSPGCRQGISSSPLTKTLTLTLSLSLGNPEGCEAGFPALRDHSCVLFFLPPSLVFPADFSPLLAPEESQGFPDFFPALEAWIYLRGAP